MAVLQIILAFKLEAVQQAEYSTIFISDKDSEVGLVFPHNLSPTYICSKTIQKSKEKLCLKNRYKYSHKVSSV